MELSWAIVDLTRQTNLSCATYAMLTSAAEALRCFRIERRSPVGLVGNHGRSGDPTVRQRPMVVATPRSGSGD